MDVNHLLLWMSARHEGSWIQFKSAVEELNVAKEELGSEVPDMEQDVGPGLPYHLLLRLNLEGLAHAEFFTKGIEGGWRVVPPSIAVHRKGKSWFGILCGARSPFLLNQLGKISLVQVEIRPIKENPDQIFFSTSDPDRLSNMAKELNCFIQFDAPIAILLNLLEIDHPIYRGNLIPLPFGKEWTITRFSSSSLKWKQSTRKEALKSKGDLFHFSIAYRHHYLYCSRDGYFELSPRIGKYLALIRRRRQVIRYHRDTSTFTVPATLRPPILIERALNLCSGFPPSFNSATGYLCYQDIPETIAQYAASLLHQEII